MTPPLSVSSLVALEQCPRSWVGSHVENARMPASEPMRVGNACHAAAEAVTQAVVIGTSRPLSEIAREAVIEYAHARGLTSAEMLEALDIMDAATSPGSTVTWGVPPQWQCRTEVPLELDAEFRPCMSKTGSYVGVLDRLQWSDDGTVEAWDWKTGRDWMTSEEVGLDAQAQWYAFLTLRFFPGAVAVTFRRVMLRLGYVAKFSFVRDEPWETRIRDRMARGRAARDEASAAGAQAMERIGPWCGDCARAAVCRTLEIARSPTIDGTFARADRARRMLALGALYHRLRDEMRADVEKNGPIALGDGTEYGVHDRGLDVLRKPLDDVIQRLRELGMDAARADAAFRIREEDAPGVVRDLLLELVSHRALRDAYAEELLVRTKRPVVDVRKAETL